MKHLIIVAILVAVVTAAVTVLLESIQLLPVAASAQAAPIDTLFGLHFKVIAFLFSLIIVFVVYSLVVFRRKPGDTADGKHIEGHTGIEILWTIGPLITVLYFSYLGAQALAETRRVDPQALEVKVVGQQWQWRFEYPQANVTSTTLNLPKDRQVLLKLTSTDVIHSFWVPEFRVKQDAVPGDKMVKELRITPTRLGEYKVRCAEMCGIQHAYMESPVVVMAANEFDEWLKKESESIPTDPVARGQRWAQQFGCLACHSLDGRVLVGPSWKGIYGKQEAIADGTSVTVNDAYIIESIKEPNKKITKGFQPNLMPATLGAQLTDDQIKDIIEYIKTIK